MLIRVGLGGRIAHWLCSLMARRFHYPLISASLPSFQVKLLFFQTFTFFARFIHTFDPCRRKFVLFESLFSCFEPSLWHNIKRGPGSSRLFIVSLRFCHPPSPRAGFRLLFITLGHSSEISSVPRAGLQTECDPWSPYLIIPDYWIDQIAYLPAPFFVHKRAY